RRRTTAITASASTSESACPAPWQPQPPREPVMPGRQVLPGQFYMLTRRCTQRQYLVQPDEETNNAFVYCLAEPAQRFQTEVLLPQQMSNHPHTDLLDRYGRIIEFTEHFHKMLAKCLNASRGRWETCGRVSRRASCSSSIGTTSSTSLSMSQLTQSR